MALPYDVQFEVIDGNGNTVKTLVHIPNNTTPANAALFAAGMATQIDGLSLGRVEKASLVIPLDISTSTRKAAPEAQSDNESGALFVFRDADTRIFRMRIPAFDTDFVSPNSKDVDMTLVTGFTGVIVDGGGGSVNPVSKANVDITAVSSGKQNFRKNLKGRRK